MHQREILFAVDQPLQQVNGSAPVLQACQLIGIGLFLGGDHRPLQPQVQRARRLHRGGLGLHQVKHLDGQVGGGEIGAGQVERPDRLYHRDAK